MVRNKTLFVHTAKHKVATFERVVIVADRAVTSCGIEHADQYSRLLNRQLRGVLAEESLRSRLDTYGVAAIVHRVEVHRHNLLFGVVVFEFDGNNPLFELREYEFDFATYRGLCRVDAARE